jgi:hypothetical protein
MPAAWRRLLIVVVALIVVGVALWLINTYVPMAGSIRAILNFVVVIATIVQVLQAFGLWDDVRRMWNNLTHRSTLQRP